MGVPKILPRRTRRRRQQPQPERIVITVDHPPTEPPRTPASPVSAVSAVCGVSPESPVLSSLASPEVPRSPTLTSLASDDDHSLKRRNSALSTLERRLSNISLRTSFSFSRLRRSRSPPPPYALEDTEAPVPVVAAVRTVEAQTPGSSSAVVAAAVASSSSPPNDVDAITVVQEVTEVGASGTLSQDTKTVATVDIQAAPSADVAGTKAQEAAQESAQEAAEELLLDVAAAPLIELPLPSRREAAMFRRLTQPIVVPRLHAGATVPFARGYAPVLGDTHGIDAATFMAFIDGLNLVTSPHPAAMALSAVAFSMQFVPHDYANAIGGVAQLLADVTTAIVAHQRGKLFLARANATLFEPRGLHVSIANTKRMRSVLGIEPKAPLLAPLSEQTVELATLERCMRHFNDMGWAASLELEARTGALMPLAKPSYRGASVETMAQWHPDMVKEAEEKARKEKEREERGETSSDKDSGDDKEKDGDEKEKEEDPKLTPLRRASSTWTTVGRTVSHGLAVVADKRVRFDIKMAEKEASRARRRAWKRHSKGKKLKEPFGEKHRVRHLSWILVRNLDEVQKEEAEKAAEKAAKKAAKAAKRSHGGEARRPEAVLRV